MSAFQSLPKNDELAAADAILSGLTDLISTNRTTGSLNITSSREDTAQAAAQAATAFYLHDIALSLRILSGREHTDGTNAAVPLLKNTQGDI